MAEPTFRRSRSVAAIALREVRNAAGFIMLLAGAFASAPEGTLAGPLAVASGVTAVGALPRQAPQGQIPQSQAAQDQAAQSGGADSQPPARAYLFRGALGPIFSRGMDRLTDRLQRAGVDASVWEFTLCGLVADKAIREYRKAPAPIVLIGHSMGGRCALQFAEKLEAENIPVSLVVTVDPAHLVPKVPLNVERFINIFLSNSILGGGDVIAEPGYRGHYASFDLKEHKEISHITIDKMDDVHAQLVGMITQLAKQPVNEPAAADGDVPVPLRYVVPPDAPVELWDSGTIVSLRSAETLRKLASDDHVPLWSLVQANQLPDSAQLVAGERIIVPRHLLPAAATSQQASARR